MNDNYSELGFSRISKTSSYSSRYTSGLTANSTISSLDEISINSNSSAIDFLYESSTSTSSAIGFLNESVIDDLGFDTDHVDESIIDNEYLHEKRESIIQQLVRSETEYLQSLETIMSVFYLPLKKNTTITFLGKKKPVCTEREMKWLFGNIEELVQVHRLTCKSLKERLRIWGPTQILSDVFQAWFPNLECYRTYLSHYDVILTTLERLTRYQPFKKFLETAQKSSKRILLRLFQLPIGCVNRYLDTITQLVSLTPSVHPDYMNLHKSKYWIEQFHKSIHNRLLEAENIEQVLLLHQSLTHASFTVRAERRLILQGQLFRVTSATKTAFHYILFSDLLIFVKPKKEGKLSYKGQVVLERARVRSLTQEEASGHANCVEIVSSFSGIDNLNTTFIGAPTVHIFCAGSEEARDKWILKLNFVIQRINKIAAAKKAQANRLMIQSRTPKGSISNDASSTSSTSLQ